MHPQLGSRAGCGEGSLLTNAYSSTTHSMSWRRYDVLGSVVQGVMRHTVSKILTHFHCSLVRNCAFETQSMQCRRGHGDRRCGSGGGGGRPLRAGSHTLHALHQPHPPLRGPGGASPAAGRPGAAAQPPAAAPPGSRHPCWRCELHSCHKECRVISVSLFFRPT